MNERRQWFAFGALAALIALLVGGMLYAPAYGAKPPAPGSCSATTQGGGVLIEWEPVSANPAVNWYTVREKGDTTPSPTIDPDVFEYLWTHSDPAVLMVRAHNPDGVSDWCEATVDSDPPDPDPTTPPPDPDPTTPPPDPDPTTPPPDVEGDLSDVGIRVFPQYTGKTYGNHEQVLDDLGRLGIKRISGLLTPGMSQAQVDFYQQAHARHGIKVWFAVGQPGDVLTDAQWAQVRDLLSGPFAGIVEIASGWNEPNHRVSNFVAPTAAHQAKLWTNVQQVNAATGQDIKVGTPPLWSGNISQQYNDLRALAPHIQGEYDTINWHLYPHGNEGADLEALIDTQVAEFRAELGNFPIVNSESGYSTSVNSSSGNPVTEAQQAALIDDLILFHLERGIAISYFEFLNDPDASLSNREAHFGLIYTPSVDPSTWRDKPAFAVVQQLLASLN